MTLLPTPTCDTVLAKIARAISPSYGWCGRCGVPWRFVDPHIVHHPDPGKAGAFALCEPCWSVLEPADRIPYYWTLVNISWLQPDLWPALEHAILTSEAIA